MKTYMIKSTENVQLIEKENNVTLSGKVLNNAQFHLGGFVTGYVELPTSFPMVVSKWFPTDGLKAEDLYQVQSRALEEVLAEAQARRLG